MVGIGGGKGWLTAGESTTDTLWPGMQTRIKTAGVTSFGVLKDATRSFAADRGNRMAAALAYRAIFAVAPLLLLAVGVFGLVVGDSDEARSRILDNIERLVGSQVAEAVEVLVASAVQTGDLAAIVGLLLFAWTASTLFMELQNSFNDVFGVPREETSGVLRFIRRRAVGMAWSLSLGLLLLAVWLVNVASGWIVSLLPDALDGLDQVFSWGARLVALLIFTILFYLMFRTMTRARVRRRAVMVGSVFTSIAFLLTAVGAGAYFSWGSQTSASRIAASFFVLLLLSYLLSNVLLLGAQVTRAYDDHLRSQ